MTLRYHKVTKIIAVFFAIIFFALGALGVCDGIRSVVSGGYADNIVFGVIIMCGFPIPCIALYLFLMNEEKEARRL